MASPRARVSLIWLVAFTIVRTGLAHAEPNGSPTPSSGKIEVAVVPLVGGDTDVGIGGGALGSVARTAPGDLIFAWKLEFGAFGTAKNASSGWTSPYQDLYAMFTRKDLAGGRIRVELRGAYTRESNLRYYGLGNASVAPPGADIASRDFFTRIHPAARARLQVHLRGPFHAVFGTMYMQNVIDVPPDSVLLRDATSGSAHVRDLLHLDTRHGLNTFEAGIIVDSRDNEVAPTRGQHHIFQARGSPWQTAGMPYRYLGVSLSDSGFQSLTGDDRVVLALRVVGDLQLGSVPFYELSRFDESSAVGGPRFIRGVPSNRYYGKRKILTNTELRTLWFAFHFGKNEYKLGGTAFFDAGRVWADTNRDPTLDGTGIGIKYGTGFGLRLQKGKTFVLRGDVAWSPDARPVGAYFLADHIF